MKKLKMEIEVTYDSVTYDGTNIMEFYEFAKKYDLLEEDTRQDDDTPGLSIRPKDIPNLSHADLLSWWLSTGEIKEKESDYGTHSSESKTYNTHNINNLPIWGKDEDFMLSIKTGKNGYLNREFIKKGTSLIIYGHEFHFVAIPTNQIQEYIISNIVNNYK